MKTYSNEIKRGIKDGLSIGLGYLSVAFAFGVQATLLSVPALISIIVSMTNLTSAGQLAGIVIIAALGSVGEMVLTQTVINSRYFLMGVSLSQKFDESFTTGKRLFLAAFVTDEIFAVASSNKGSISAKYFFGLTVLPYIGWTVGTAAGALFGQILPQQIQAALGVALYAMFIAIVIPPAIKAISVSFVALLSAGLSCAFYYVPWLKSVFSQGFAIVICTLISAVLAAIIFPVKEEENEDERNS